MDSPANSLPVMCEVCGTYFETRRGLSSHARLHLRQLGVTLSESSGAPIDLLYQLIKERDGSLPDFISGSAPAKKTLQQESRTVGEGVTFQKGESRATTTPQKMDHPGSPARLKESAASLLPSSPSLVRLSESKSSGGSSSSSLDHQTTTKPLWAPLETDAPLTLDTSDEVHVCQLCGCWYENRKGLSNHAQTHLRQIGFPDSEIKGNPIDLLYQIMEEEDLKPIHIEKQKDAPARSSSKPTSNMVSPPRKKPKVSEDCTCILCGEEFENRKGLACHARCHLRQIGISDLMGKSSAIDTLQELISSGMLKALHSPKKGSSSSVSFPALVLSPAPGGSQASLLSTSPSLSPAKSSPEAPLYKAPKAKKGFRLAVDPFHRKPKPEPAEMKVSDQQQDSKDSIISPTQISPEPCEASLALSSDGQPPPTVICDYCGQLFETRKALSCHARAHLRQLGLTWSIKTSPIDLLKDFMMQGESSSNSRGSSGKAMWIPQGIKRPFDNLHSGDTASKSLIAPLDFSIKEKSSCGKSGSSNTDTSCELCGFDFENRKALASHARAHLRQLGIIEWKADGASSPIELLNELIRKDPTKVAAITRRYRTGDLYIKKTGKAAASPSLSLDPDSVSGSSRKASVQHQQQKKGREDSGSSRHSHGHTRTFGAHCDPNVRSRGGGHPPKHVVSAKERNQETNSHHQTRSGSIPAMLPKPPLTPLVKLVGKMYSLKCRFCEEVFHGPLSVQEQWITHLQKHILSLGYKGKASPPAAPVAAPVAAPALVHPVAV